MASLVSNESWEKANRTEMENAFNSGKQGVDIMDIEGFRWYLLPPGVQLPKTFAFRTESGQIGLFQVVEVIDKPISVKIRCKLIEKSSPVPAEKAKTKQATEKSAAVFGPVVTRTLFQPPKTRSKEKIWIKARQSSCRRMLKKNPTIMKDMPFDGSPNMGWICS